MHQMSLLVPAFHHILHTAHQSGSGVRFDAVPHKLMHRQIVHGRAIPTSQSLRTLRCEWQHKLAGTCPRISCVLVYVHSFCSSETNARICMGLGKALRIHIGKYHNNFSDMSKVCFSQVEGGCPYCGVLTGTVVVCLLTCRWEVLRECEQVKRWPSRLHLPKGCSCMSSPDIWALQLHDCC